MLSITFAIEKSTPCSLRSCACSLVKSACAFLETLTDVYLKVSGILESPLYLPVVNNTLYRVVLQDRRLRVNKQTPPSKVYDYFPQITVIVIAFVIKLCPATVTFELNIVFKNSYVIHCISSLLIVKQIKSLIPALGLIPSKQLYFEQVAQSKTP